jgi:hypothetical protein
LERVFMMMDPDKKIPYRVFDDEVKAYEHAVRKEGGRRWPVYKSAMKANSVVLTHVYLLLYRHALRSKETEILGSYTTRRKAEKALKSVRKDVRDNFIERWWIKKIMLRS